MFLDFQGRVNIVSAKGGGYGGNIEGIEWSRRGVKEGDLEALKLDTYYLSSSVDIALIYTDE